MATTEEQKKAILPFLQRADEIGKVEPKVAYYCRLYAVQQGIALENRSAQIGGVLNALLSKLAHDKEAIALGDNDAQYCENFAITVFSRADKTDRAGRADKNTAMTFYAASIFFEILNQFAPIEADLADMQRYAAWKAADIRKALREGRTPTPGAPNEDPFNAASTSGESELPAAPQFPPPPAAFVPDSIDAAGPATANPTSTRAPRFHAGSRVLYDDREHGRLVQGTVAKLKSEFVEDGYMVALSDCILDLDESVLAPDLERGDVVQYTAAPGETVSANVEKVAAASWPPTYQLLTVEGLQVTAFPDQLIVPHQQENRPQPAQLQQQPAGTGRQSTADAPPNPFLAQSSAPSPAPPPPPPSYSTTQQPYGDAAALQNNLTAAQRGDDTAAELRELNTGNARGTTQQSMAPPPSTPENAGPALQPKTERPLQPPPTPSAVQQSTSPHYTTLPGVIAETAPGFGPDLAAVSEAQKLARYAASSLGFEDVQTAIKQLADALKLLTQPRALSSVPKKLR